MGIPQLLVSMLLFIVLFLGIGFILNMLLRKTWIMAIVYPIIVILIVDNVRFFKYFTEPKVAFNSLVNDFSALGGADVYILSSGFVGALLSGIIIKLLRKNGYQMF
ncbi:YuiB family protein [Calidifontibacillus oryziterrae]|uniref:YuiB family protein n=1 Tax=Calidifontibacillus oryziterrae TaxID=1191699 RepID=UPI0002F52FD2|nr:YuiB family protein [Calidifontibacillus oryziterrae]